MPFNALEELSNREKRLLLINLEEAKRLEFDRRRKLRLQQVRQQSKDLAFMVRQKVTAEGQKASKVAQRQAQADEQDKRDRLLKSLRDAYKEQVKEIGTAHKDALSQPPLSVIEQEKQEVLDVIKRARSTIAAQKQKAEKSFMKESMDLVKKRKEMVRAVEDMRASVISATKKPSKPPQKKLPSPCKKKNPKINSKSKGSKEVNFHSDEISDSTSHSAIGEVVRLFGHVLHPTESTILSPRRHEEEFNDSPPNPCYSPSQFKSRSSDSPPRSPPLRNIYTSPHRWRMSDGEEDALSDVSCSSDVTWRPRRLTKSSRSQSLIQLYDHKSRTTKEVENTFGRVTHIDPSSLPDMRSEIAEEEAAAKLIESSRNASQEKLSKRSRAALRSARLRKNFQNLLVNLNQQEKKKRVRMAVEGTYPAEFHMLPERRKELKQKGILKNTQRYPIEDSDEIKDFNKLPSSLKPKSKKPDIPICQKFPVDPEESAKTLSTLVNHLQLEREKCLRQSLGAGDSPDVTKEQELPHWISCPDKCNRSPTASPQKIRSPQKTTEPQSPTRYYRSPKKPGSPDRNRMSLGSPQQCTPEKVPKYSDAGGSGERYSTSPVQGNNRASDSSDMEPGKPIEVEAEVHPPPKQRCEIQAYPTNIKLNSDREWTLDEECKSEASPQGSTTDGSFDGLTIVLKVCENKSTKKFGPVKEVTVVDGSKKPPVKETKKFVDSCQNKRASIGANPTIASDRGRRTSQGTSVQSPRSGYSSSTSYMSPPEELTPEQLSILNRVLKRVSAKTKNPKLHDYITQLLHMSRESIEDLAVSVSEVSLESNLIREMECCKSWNTPPCVPSTRPHLIYSSDSSPSDKHNCYSFPKAFSSFSSESSTPDLDVRACKPCCTEKLDTDIDDDQCAQFDLLAQKYSKRINDLVRLVDAVHHSCSSSMDKSELTLNDASSYLNAPSNINSSVPMSNSIKRMAQRGEYERLDQSEINHLYQSPFDVPTPNARGTCEASPPNSTPGQLGVSRNLFPRPYEETDEGMAGFSRPRPPTALSQLRKSIPNASPHELSTILEGDTPIPSQQVIHSNQVPDPIPDTPLLMDSSFPPPLSDTDSEVSSIKNSPVKKGPIPVNRSAATPLSDISNSPRLNKPPFTTDTSSSDFEDVFQSLGIGWALSTLKKTRAAHKRQTASSSSSIEGSPLRPLSRSRGLNHSTPIKQPFSRPSNTFEKNLKLSAHASISGHFNMSLTPPDYSLSAPLPQSTKQF